MLTSDSDGRGGSHGPVPLIVGVTGHRDLVPHEDGQIRLRVTAFLKDLQQKFPDRPVQVLSPLAEGADRLVGDVAMDLGFDLVIVMPMPRRLYEPDFTSEESRLEFARMCEYASSIYELPPVSGSALEELGTSGTARDLQYAQLGVFICAHCHILLALWDGRSTDDVGGTAQVVRFHHDDVMAGYLPSTAMSKQLLANDESDLVYHIVVSRQRNGDVPAHGLTPFECTWFTADPDTPRSRDLPEKYSRIFERTSEFNREVQRHAEQIDADGDSLSAAMGDGILPGCTERIEYLYRAADWLAIHYQRRLMQALRVTHGLAFVMGVLFLLYSDIEAQRSLMLLFAVFFVLALAVHGAAARNDWHGRYLDYRTLAEGLRVQFYWAVAGVTSDAVTKYSHDNFLQKQDIDLAWIRNVMRVAGIGCDAVSNRDERGLQFSISAWLGDAEHGQTGYYRAKTAHHLRRRRQLEVLGKLTGVVVAVILVSTVVVSSADLRNGLFFVLGLLLLVLGIRQSFAYQIAEKELIKQYRFMLSIFANARGRLAGATDDDERRRILRVLGESALDEHAEWIFVRRDRPLDSGAVWRMET